MDRKLIFLILIVSFAFQVTSVDIFTGFKYSGDTFKIGPDNFSIQLSPDWETLAVKNSKEKILLNAGGCEYTKYYRYCFYNAIMDAKQGLISFDKYTGNQIPAINISFESLIPDIKITRVVSNSNPLEYEKVTVTTTITNNGKKDALIDYKENITLPALLTKCDRCEYYNNQAMFYSVIAQEDSKNFVYEIDPKNIDSVTLTPIIKYKTDISNGTLTTPTLKITPKKTLIVTYSGVKDMYIEEDSEVIITFKNNDDKDKIVYESLVLYNENYNVVEKVINPLEKTIFRDTLEPGTEKKYTIKITPIKSGKTKFIIFSDYKLGSKQLETNTSIDLNLKVENPKFIFGIEHIYYSDQPKKINLSINNKVSKNSFKNININLFGPNLNENFIIPFLKYGREILVYNKNFTLFENETKKDVTLNIDYETIYGEKFSYNLKKTITIKPIKELISISYEVESFKQLKNDLSLNIYLENNGPDWQLINISSKIINGTALIEGKEKNEIFYKDFNFDLDPNSKRKISSATIVNENKNPLIETILEFWGVKNRYEIKEIGMIDFNSKKYVRVSLESKILNSKDFIQESTGVLTENIEKEEDLKYEPVETIEDKSLINKETVIKDTNTENQEKISTPTKKEEKGFFEKLWDIIKSFF